MADDVTDKITAAKNLIDGLTGSKVVLTLLFGMVCLILYSTYENRQAVATLLATNTYIQIAGGVGAVLVLVALGFHAMFSRIDILNNQREKELRAYYEQRIKDLLETIVEERAEARGAAASRDSLQLQIQQILEKLGNKS